MTYSILYTSPIPLFHCAASDQISKSNVVDDMVESNRILYRQGEKPDHCASLLLLLFPPFLPHPLPSLPPPFFPPSPPPLFHLLSSFLPPSLPPPSFSLHSLTVLSPLIFQVVIKYVPYVGDSKRAMDEYTSEIFMGGHNTIVMHNTCEDSLLAAPLILDLIILAELFERIEVKRGTRGLQGTWGTGHVTVT